jgi:hypothetical protein
VVWLIINFIFFRGGRFQIIELSDDDEQQPAAKGAWNISLDISQAAYIVFFFFLNNFFFFFYFSIIQRLPLFSPSLPHNTSALPMRS